MKTIIGAGNGLPSPGKHYQTGKTIPEPGKPLPSRESHYRVGKAITESGKRLPSLAIENRPGQKFLQVFFSHSLLSPDCISRRRKIEAGFASLREKFRCP